MKKIALFLSFILISAISGCGSQTMRIGIAIPSDGEEYYAWTDEEISPSGNKITIHSCDEIGDSEIILKPIEVKEENAYDEPTFVGRGETVTIYAEKGAWFKLGMRMIDNPVPGKVKYFEIKNITVRIPSKNEEEFEIYVEDNGSVVINGVYYYDTGMEVYVTGDPDPGAVNDIELDLPDGRKITAWLYEDENSSKVAFAIDGKWFEFVEAEGAMD